MKRHRGPSSRLRLIEATAVLAVSTALVGPALAGAPSEGHVGSGLPGTALRLAPVFLAQARPAALSGCWRAIAGRNSAVLCFTRTGSKLRASVSSVSVYPGKVSEQCEGQSGQATVRGRTVRVELPRRNGNCLRGAQRSNSARQRVTCQLVGPGSLSCSIAAYNWDGRTVYRVRHGVSFRRVR